MFSKKATKIDEIFTVDLTLCKGHLISKANCQAVVSPKKQTKGIWLYYVVKSKKANSFVRFFGESTTWHFAFKINWPLVNVKGMVKISSIFMVFLENMNFSKVWTLILKKPEKFETIFHLIWRMLSIVKSSGRLFSNFVAFLENLSFIWLYTLRA